MTVQLTLTALAQQDVRAAFQWYEHEDTGLGAAFLEALEATFESIRRMPTMYPQVYSSYRRALLQRFPYCVFYEYDVAANHCLVYYVFHCARHPRRWQNRLRRR